MTNNNPSDPITAFITLKPGREKPVKQSHPWIFSGAISKVEGTPESGDLVQILDKNGRFLATAYFNPFSQIRCRILSWDAEETIDADFWKRRMEQAINGRSTLNLEPNTTAYRLIFGESDLIPGLVVDKYGDYLVMQCLTKGIDVRKEMLTEILAELCQSKGIVERSDVDVRKKEMLKQTTGLLWGEMPPADFTIQENNIQFAVNLAGGHKTGFLCGSTRQQNGRFPPQLRARQRRAQRLRLHGWIWPLRHCQRRKAGDTHRQFD